MSHKSSPDLPDIRPRAASQALQQIENVVIEERHKRLAVAAETFGQRYAAEDLGLGEHRHALLQIQRLEHEADEVSWKQPTTRSVRGSAEL